MPRRIKLNEHLSADQWEQRYRQAEAPVTRSHFHILWLLAQGKTAQAVAEVTGYCPYWIGQSARRYNDGGPDALGDQRQHNPGGQWLLSEEQKAELDQALKQPPEDGGCGLAPKWRPGSKRKGTNRCIRSGAGTTCVCWIIRPRFPVPAITRPTPRQEMFKKTLPAFVSQIEATHPASPVELWAFDDHRTGGAVRARSRGSGPGILTERLFGCIALRASGKFGGSRG